MMYILGKMLVYTEICLIASLLFCLFEVFCPNQESFTDISHIFVKDCILIYIRLKAMASKCSLDNAQNFLQ